MSYVAENFWPVHSIAWFVFALVGIAMGYFLTNVTQTTVVNVLILVGILLAMAFAAAQAIGMALELGPADLTSWAKFGDFWLQAQEMTWIINGRLLEVIWSTGIGLAISAVFGIIMIIAGKDRV